MKYLISCVFVAFVLSGCRTVDDMNHMYGFGYLVCRQSLSDRPTKRMWSHNNISGSTNHKADINEHDTCVKMMQFMYKYDMHKTPHREWTGVDEWPDMPSPDSYTREGYGGM